MNTYDLGIRSTGNRLAKITSISKTTIEGVETYKFYSSYDECSYSYLGYSLGDALKAYEKDTRWQGYAQIHYFTTDESINEEFKKLPPW